jgi:putative transposase
MTRYHQPLLPNESNHLFSRAIGNEKLFRCSENYRYFLEKIYHHTAAVYGIYCYALLPNHFHLLARIHDDDSVMHHFNKVKKKPFDPQKNDLSDFVMERFSNCLNSYTKAFNKMYGRKGGLFMDYLKRSRAKNENDFTTFIWYIHKNAVKHQLTKSIGSWEFDSYNPILSDTPTFIKRDEVIEWFGGREAYIRFHQQPLNL